jgi:hypothetical protein
LTAREFQEFTGISNQPILRLGGWRALRVAAGLTDRASGPRECFYSEGMIRREAEQLIAEVGPHLTLLEFTRRTRIDATTFRRHCGSWNAFRESLGLARNAPGPGRRYSDAELIVEYHRVVLKLGRLPSEREFARLARMPYQQLRWRFGRWREVKKLLTRYAAALHASPRTSQPQHGCRDK